MQRTCYGTGEMWRRERMELIFSYIHSAYLFSTCSMSDTVLGLETPRDPLGNTLGLGNTQTTQRPSPSGFTFTEGMLLILYGVCVAAWC